MTVNFLKFSRLKFSIFLAVDKLTKKLRLFENESRNARTNVSSLQIDNEVLKKRCNELDTELAQRITEEDFEKSMKKVER